MTFDKILFFNLKTFFELLVFQINYIALTRERA